MKITKMRELKKSGTLVLAAMMIVLSMNTTAFASSPQSVSEEEIGIDVYNPGGFRVGEIGTRAYIDDNYVTVSGGTLWTTWNGGSTFRANYIHSSKEHRCSVKNDHDTLKRSEWVSAGKTAISPWLDQTFTDNRAYAATR